MFFNMVIKTNILLLYINIIYTIGSYLSVSNE